MWSLETEKSTDSMATNESMGIDENDGMETPFSTTRAANSGINPTIPIVQPKARSKLSDQLRRDEDDDFEAAEERLLDEGFRETVHMTSCQVKRSNDRWH